MNNKVESDLVNLEQGFSEYYSFVETRFQSSWNHQYDQKSLASAHKAAAEGLSEQRDQLHHKLDDLCSRYLGATAEARRSLRESVSTRRPLLYALRDHVGWCARRIVQPDDRNFLRTALAAISLQDNLLDFRDNYLSLGNLYLVATRVGIQPSQDFCKIGLLSNSESRNKRQPDDSTQNFLARFEESAYFRESIAPKLG